MDWALCLVNVLAEPCVLGGCAGYDRVGSRAKYIEQQALRLIIHLDDHSLVPFSTIRTSTANYFDKIQRQADQKWDHRSERCSRLSD